MVADGARVDVRYGTGDDGSTWLLEGKRVRKHHPRVVACGEVDELNSVLGVCRSLLRDRHPDLDAELRKVQEALFRIGAELASEVPENLGIKQIGREDVSSLEAALERLGSELEELRHFVYPSGSLPGAMLHFARAVARRAERAVVLLSDREKVNPEIVRYLNRLSTLLFQMARAVNAREKVPEDKWPGRALG
jgi:cob(I)alamin adenosyltransferase